MTITSLGDERVRRLVSMEAVIDAVRAALVGFEEGKFAFPQRLSFAGGRALVMPVFHSATNSIVTKSISLDPERDPFISGTVSWASSTSPHTLVADAVSVTALRTGAVVGVAVDLLAVPDAKRLVVFGAGAQSLDQVRAVAAVRCIEDVTMISRTMARAVTATNALSDEFPAIRFTPATDADDLGRADVVACATPSTKPLFGVDGLSKRVMVAAIGSFSAQMHELPQEILAGTRPLYVDDVAACLQEAGEVMLAKRSGCIDDADLVPLGRAVVRGVPRGGRAVFKSVGFAPLDWAVMHLLSQRLLTEDRHPLPGSR